MRIVRLEADKIKVVLSATELADMNIDAKSLFPGSPGLNTFLCEILDVVKAETGFSVEDGQILAEASEFSDGIILVLSHPKGIKPISSNRVIFELADTDALFGMLTNAPFSCLAGMHLYAYGNSFYLTVPRRKIPALIYEYSLKNNKSSITESILCEHGKRLAGGYRLLSMAAAVKKLN